jgi:hypothetical protein
MDEIAFDREILQLIEAPKASVEEEEILSMSSSVVFPDPTHLFDELIFNQDELIKTPDIGTKKASFCLEISEEDAHATDYDTMSSPESIFSASDGAFLDEEEQEKHFSWSNFSASASSPVFSCYSSSSQTPSSPLPTSPLPQEDFFFLGNTSPITSEEEPDYEAQEEDCFEEEIEEMVTCSLKKKRTAENISMMMMDPLMVVEDCEEIELLSKEANDLAAQMDFLLSNTNANVKKSFKRTFQHMNNKSTSSSRNCTAMTPDIAAKISSSNQLYQLVSEQEIHLQNMKAMLALAPTNDIRLTLMSPFETYIHLPKDFNQRRETLLGMRQEKLDTALAVVQRKLEGMDLNTSYFHLEHFEKFEKTYSIETVNKKYKGIKLGDIMPTLHAVLFGTGQQYPKEWGVSAKSECMDAMENTYIQQRAQYTLRLPRRSNETEEQDRFTTLESNAVYFWKYTKDFAVMTCDYVDNDELYPYHSKEHIRKDCNSGLILLRHFEPDGKESVIMKKYGVIKNHLYGNRITSEIQETILSKVEIVVGHIVENIGKNT